MLDDFRDNTPPTVELGNGTKIAAAIGVVLVIGAVGAFAWESKGYTPKPVAAVSKEAPAPGPVASAEPSNPTPDTSAATETPPAADKTAQGYPLTSAPPAPAASSRRQAGRGHSPVRLKRK